MPREVCQTCQRPLSACICDAIQSIENKIEIGILQHPAEAKHSKGTAIIAYLSLENVQLWIAESLTEVPDLVDWIQQERPVYLLYPETEDMPAATSSYTVDELRDQGFEQGRFLVIDGTWRKTFKMMQLNPELQTLSRVSIAPEIPSAYKVRKQKDDQSLSTVEAIAELLSQIEQDPPKYRPLLKAFEQIQQRQLAFRTPSF